MKRQNKVIRICRSILIISSVLCSCAGVTFLVLKTVANGTSLTSDAWLGFWGSIIGSVVTMGGIILTLTYENNQNNNIRRMEAQPIITLKALTLDAERTENEGSYSLRVFDGDLNDVLHFDLPDIEIRNIGLNFATQISFDFMFDYSGASGRHISILDTKDSKQISLSLDISKNCIYSFFKNVHVYEKNKLFHACCAGARTYLAQSNRKASLDRLEKVSYAEGSIITTFEDIYGNIYEQRRTALINYVELRDEPAFVYITFPEFSKGKLIK